jgi:hypothetical protein
LFNNSVITPVGGIYHVGNLPQDSARSYRILADYNNCTTDSLRIVAGWDCSAFPANLGAYACTPAVAWLYVQPQPSVLQATFNTPVAPLGICDSMLVEIQVVSSQIANVKDILVQVGLPLTGGLTFSPGSAQMQYPTTAAYTPIANPVIAGNLLSWDINTVNALIAARDLPGTIRPDSNIFNLRFYLYTNCNMISGDRLRLGVEGSRGCGDQLTPLLLLSNPINIVGAVQPYTAQVSSTVTQVSACPLVKRVTVQMVNAGAAPSNLGDSLFFNLGPGYAYAGSFTGQTNAPSNINPQTQTSVGGVRLGWAIPTGLVVGDTMRFAFNVTVGAQVACGTDIATVQTVSNQTLFCARTSTTCATSTQTGSSLLSMSVVRANPNFIAFNATLQPIVGGGTYTYNATVQNTGPAIAPGVPVLVTFYCDTDNSTGYTVGDNPLGTYTTTAGIASNGTLSFSGNFFIPNGSCAIGQLIYALIVPNSSAGLCICDTAFSNTNVILPVTWLSVTGEALAVENEVRWEATLTAGHDYFVLEKQVNANWEAISARIYGAQNAYSGRDVQPSARERYRVRAVDQDGRVAYSAEVEILRDAFAQNLKVYPNPGSHTVYLQALGGADYRLYNALGQMVLAGKLLSDAPEAIDVSDLAAGVFLVEFRQGSRQATVRLVVE